MGLSNRKSGHPNRLKMPIAPGALTSRFDALINWEHCESATAWLCPVWYVANAAMVRIGEFAHEAARVHQGRTRFDSFIIIGRTARQPNSRGGDDMRTASVRSAGDWTEEQCQLQLPRRP
jgi:hypothetical protein